MRNSLKLLLALTCVLSFELASAGDDNGLQGWIDGPQRSEKNRLRDGARKPAETLAFFGLRPAQTVVEIWPSVGTWWLEILAPYLRERGHYIAALHAGAHNPAAAEAEQTAVATKQSERPELYGRMMLAHSPGLAQTVKPASVDLLLTFLNLHNWIADGNAAEMLREFHQVLKPGGILGVVDHRGRAELSQDEQFASGYLREDETIALIEKQGFKLVARSEINANPRDRKDYPAGVWTLPPSLRLQDVDREKYLAIGESDKFTLKFVKLTPP